MICPHCESDTPATDRYCVNCGLAVDLDIEVVTESFEAEHEARALRETELFCRGYLLSAAALLLAILFARWLLLAAVPELPVLPPAIVPADPRACAVEPLPLPAVDLEVPKKR
jgi:predicted amidophosphoribosyltransferase